MHWLFRLVVLSAILGVACTSAAPTGSRSQGQSPSASGGSSGPKTLVAAVNEDPKNWWDGVNGGGGGGSRELIHFVNQFLASIGPDGTPSPRLLTELPSIQKGTWRVSPDGTMETTYTLRPDVKWHDGTPLTADDLVFSWEVGRDPQVPNGNAGAVKLISKMEAMDATTAVATWSQTYAFADRLEHREFYPLAKHAIEQAYRENKENLLAQPYFGDQYVGLGPFKVTAWDHGSSIDLVANEDYFLGKPKLDRIRVLIIPDPSTAIANMQAGAVNVFLPTGGPDYDQLLPLKEMWQGNGKGEVVTEAIRWRFIEPQKAKHAQPIELQDPRMRQAILYALNRKEMTQSLLGDLGVVADSWVHPTFAEYAQVKDAITLYPFDQRRSVAMLGELGWTPGPDGVLQRGGAHLQMTVSYEVNQEKDATVVQQDLKKAGIDADLVVVPNVMLRDAEYRASYTGLQLSQNPMGTLSAVRRFAGDQIPTSNNKWAGTNRGAFSNADWDEVGNGLRVALDDDQRLKLERDLLQVFSFQLPALPTMYEIQPVPVQGFKGLRPITGVPHTGNIMHTTNAWEWELTQ